MIAAEFKKLVTTPWKFNLFLLKKLPAAFFSGVRIVSVTDEAAVVKVPFKWFSQNPFKSTYFACLAMAGELASGTLALGNIWGKKPKVSMLVVNVKADFFKKATETTYFTCNDGITISQLIEEVLSTGGPREMQMLSKGVNKNGDHIADLYVTWSFKAKI